MVIQYYYRSPLFQQEAREKFCVNSQAYAHIRSLRINICIYGNIIVQEGTVVPVIINMYLINVSN